MVTNHPSAFKMRAPFHVTWWHALTFLMLAGVVWLAFFWQLGALPLYDLDEGAFTEATREMLASGHYITPYRDGEPRYDKPILIYWLQAASVHLLGLHEFALRLPSAIAATLWLIALWLFTKRYLDITTATVAALVMACSLEISLIGKAAVADAVLNLWLTLACFELYRCIISTPGQQTRWWCYDRLYVWLGLGFLTKGPVALFFPIIIGSLYLWLRADWSQWRQIFARLRGWIIFCAITAPWFIAIYYDDGAGFFVSFFLHHNIERMTGVIHGHAGFPGYYFAMLPLVISPFIGWFISIIPAIKPLWADQLDRFLLLWFISVFLFFSLAKTQLPHYLVYGLTPVFILLARYRHLVTHHRLAFWPPLLVMLLLVFLPEIVQLGLLFADKVHEQALLQLGQHVLDGQYRLQMVIATVLMIIVSHKRTQLVWQRLIIAGIIQLVVLFGAVAPRVLYVLQQPVKEAALIARTLDQPTVIYRTSMPSFSLYRQAITPNRLPQPGDIVFLRIDKLASLHDLYPDALTVLYQRGAVILIAIKTKSEIIRDRIERQQQLHTGTILQVHDLFLHPQRNSPLIL
jgi:4-amino-4-deoxy-L-arabinose transferase-like glycosyltransferase